MLIFISILFANCEKGIIFVLMKQLMTLFLFVAAPITGLCRDYNFSAQRISTADGLPTNVVISIWQDTEGYICFNTRNGLCIYDGYILQTMGAEPVACPRKSEELHTHDAKWIREGQGRLARIGKDGKRRSWQLIPSEIITYTRNDHFQVCDVDERTEAVSTYGSGLYLYDKPTGEMTQLTKENTGGLLDDDYLTGVFVDRTGCIWMVEDYIGVKCLRMNRLHYRPLWLHANAAIQDVNYIRCIAPMGDDELLISNQTGDVYSYNTIKDKIFYSGNKGYRLYSALRDSKGRIWKGTRGDGLWLEGKRVEGLPSPHIFNIRESIDGSILVSMLESGVARISHNGNISLILKGKNVHDAQTDRLGRLWVAGEEGLYLLSRQYQITDSLSGHFVCLHIDSQGVVWAGSTDKGLVRIACHSKGFQATYYNKENGLANNGVCSITEDKTGRLWLGTEEGLSCLDPSSGDIINHQVSEGPLSNVFCERAAVCLNNGLLLFGSHNGLIEVAPEHSVLSTPPATAITGLLVNGERLNPDSTLSYRQNNLTFLFSNFQYAHQRSVLYQYRLDGVDSDWCKPTADHTAIYRRLTPGHYTFHVRSTYGSDVWGEEAVLHMHISQPWWNTWWAWMLYFLALTITLFLTLLIVRRIMHLHRRLDVERRVSAFKQDFYERIQRELRNPVTVLQGAAENVQMSGTSKTTVQSLRRGSRRMLRLMDMIRQFHQLDNVEIQVRSEMEEMNDEVEKRFRKISDIIHAEENELKELAPPPINSQTVVIVEEDEDTLTHLTDTLSPYFKIVGCRYMGEVLGVIEENAPSLLIIDITNNHKAGCDLTKAILSDHATLSIFHLSAYDDTTHHLRSLRSGAVDYIVKPFSSKVLVERIAMRQKEKTKNEWYYTNEKTVSDKQESIPRLLTDVKDKRFIDQFYALLNNHISDNNFSVEQFATLMHLGRTQFYKRVKSLTGKTPVQHLHRARMDYSARLLRESKMTVEEIMVRSGFSSPTHFYKAFRRQFGCSPRQYRMTQSNT